VLAVGLLTKPDVHRHARPGGAPKQRLESFRRHFGLEELVEVLADPLGEVRRQRHLGIDDQLHTVARRRLEQRQHPLDDRLARCSLLIWTHLGGGDFQIAGHCDPPLGATRPQFYRTHVCLCTPSAGTCSIDGTPGRRRAVSSRPLPETIDRRLCPCERVLLAPARYSSAECLAQILLNPGQGDYPLWRSNENLARL